MFVNSQPTSVGYQSRQHTEKKRRKNPRLASGIERLGERIVLSNITIPVTGAQDLIYEASRNTLYMPTSSGLIHRFLLTNNTELTPWDVGDNLLGGDVTPDGQFLYVVESQRVGGSALVRKVDLNSGTATTLVIDSVGGNRGGFDLNIGPNGIGFITLQHDGSGASLPLYQLDTTTDTITVRPDDPIGPGFGGAVTQNTQIHRSNKRGLMLFAQGNISSGPLFVYDATTDSFPASTGTGLFNSGVPYSVSRNGDLIARGAHNAPFRIYNEDLQVDHVLSGFGADGASAFDAVRDILYVVNSSSDELMAFDTNSWELMYSLPFGEDVNIFGQLAVSDDGAHVFFTRQQLVRIIDVTPPAIATIADVDIQEGNNGVGTAVVTVRLSESVRHTVTFDYTTVAGTALYGSDLTQTAGTVVFTPFNTTQTISIPIVSDIVAERDEYFQVEFSNGQNALLGNTLAMVVLRNDDSGLPPALSDVATSVTFDENTVNSAEQLIDDTVTFTDVDTPSLTGGNLVATIANGIASVDKLAIRNQGIAAGQISVNGNEVSFGGVVFGTYQVDTTTGVVLTVDFTTGAATSAAIDSLIQNLTYQNLSDSPAPTRSLTIVVSDDFGARSEVATTLIMVNSENDPPSISTVNNITVIEGTSPVATFTISDDEVPVNLLTVTAVSSNQAILPNANIALSGTGNQRSVKLTPIANQIGTTTISITVNDGVLQTVRTFTLTIVADNDPPTIADISNQSTNEDVSVSVPFTINDPDSAIENLTISATSSNENLVPSTAITFVGIGSTRTAVITPAANLSGTTTITLTVSDGVQSNSDTFQLSVISVADAPNISNIPSQSTDEDISTAAIPFTVGDIDSPLSGLTITARSSNPALVPDGNIILAGSDASRTIKVIPVAGMSGTTTITLLVSDGVLSTQDSFVLTVVNVDDAPTISNILGRTILEDSSTGLLGFTISDSDTAFENLVVKATSSNPAVIPNENLLLSGVGGNRFVVATPPVNTTGSTTISLTVSDGTSTRMTSFPLTVIAVNDLPTISSISNQTIDEDHATNPIAFSVSDIETGAGNLTITTKSSNTELIGPGNIVFGGSMGNRTILITPKPNLSGSTDITVSVSDGADVVSTTFTVTVNPINDGPTMTSIADQTITEDSSSNFLEFIIGDLETAATNLTVSATSSNPGLIPNANVQLAGSGANRTVKVAPITNQFGSSTVTLVVSDGTLTNTTSFVVTVTPINDAPTLSDIGNQLTQEDTSTTAVEVLVNDLDNSADALILSATSSNTQLVPDNHILFSGTGTSRKVVVSPTANHFGTAVITVTVSDGAIAVSDTFEVTVTPVNDAPVISGFLNLTILEDTTTTPLSFTIGDLESNTESLTVAGSSSNPDLIPNSNIQITGTGVTRTIVMTPLANQAGVATITIAVSDGERTSTGSLTITVTGVNDAPAISSIPSQTILEDHATANLSFFLADLDTAASLLTIRATSSNPTLIPNSNITLDGAGLNRVIAVTPAEDQFGLAEITVEVSDGNLTSRTSFSVLVQPVNDAPLMRLGPNVTVEEDTPAQLLNHWAPLFATGPSNESSQSMDLLLTNDRPDLFQSGPVLSISGDLRFTLAPDAFGEANISVSLRDNGGTEQGGVDTLVGTFRITVTPVDDPVEYSNPSPVAQVLKGKQPQAISPDLTILDVDSPDVDYSNGQLTVSIIDGGNKSDRISLPTRRRKSSPTEIILAGTAVFYRNLKIGTAQGGEGATPLQVQFEAGISQDAVNALIRAVTFRTRGRNSTSTPRTVRFRLENAANVTIAETTTTIEVSRK